MNENEKLDQPVTQQEQSALGRLTGIFLEPSRTFGEINRKPGWALPLIVLCLVAVVANVYIMNAIGYENIVRQQMMQSPQVRDLPADQREELIDRQMESPLFSNLAYFSPVFVIITMLLLSVIFFLALMALGSESRFSKVFAVTNYSFFAYSLINAVLGVLIVFLAEDKQAIDVQNVVQSNAGFLVDKADSPVLHTLASSLDLLSFYLMYLMALGLSIVGKRIAFGTCLTTVVMLWLVYVGGKVGLAALFG